MPKVRAQTKHLDEGLVGIQLPAGQLRPKEASRPVLYEQPTEIECSSAELHTGEETQETDSTT